MFVAVCSSQVYGNGAAAIIGGSLFDAVLRDKTILSDVGKVILDIGAEFNFQEVRSARRAGRGGLGIFQNRILPNETLSRHLVYMSAAGLLKWMEANPDIPARLEYPADGVQKPSTAWIDEILQRFFETKNLTVCMR